MAPPPSPPPLPPLELVPLIPPGLPTSLMLRSAKATGERVNQTQNIDMLLSQHDGVIQLAVCHLKGQMLIDYVNARMGLFDLSCAFSQMAFERLLLKVMNEKKDFSNSKQIRFQLSEILDRFEKDVAHMSQAMHFSVTCLGLSDQFKQPDLHRGDYDFKFLSAFMRITEIYGHEMSPSINQLQLLVPATQSRYKFPPNLTSFKKNRGLLEMHYNEEWFFLNLKGMAQSNSRGAYHEAIALGTGVIVEHKPLHSFDRQFNFYLYGMMALSMAKMFVEKKAVFGCLAHAKSFLHCESFKITFAYFLQSIFATWGHFKLENKIFEDMFYSDFCLPIPSALFKKMFAVHFESEIKRIENCLMHILTVQTYHSNCGKYFCQKDYKSCLDYITKKLTKLQSLVYVTLGRIEFNQRRTSNLAFHFVKFVNQCECCINVYQNCVYNIEKQSYNSNFSGIERVAQQNFTCENNLCNTVKVFANQCANLQNRSVHTFCNGIQEIVNKETERSNMLYSVNAGDVYFTAVCLYFSAFGVDKHYLGHFKCQDFFENARRHYEYSTNGRHYRLDSMKSAYHVFFESTKHADVPHYDIPLFRPDHLFDVEPLYNSVADQPVSSVQWMLKHDNQILPDLIRFGADSLHQCSYTVTRK